ncbi:MAG: hypothetical protein AB7C97_05145 [Oscillospiraceae bacterium]
MRKFGVIISAFAVICGAAGFFLRKNELLTVFDAETGLAEPFARVSVMLMSLLIVAAMVIVIAVFGAFRGKRTEEVYEKAFAIKSVGVLALYFILGLFAVAGAVLYWLGTPAPVSGIPFAAIAFSVFAALSGVSFIILAVHSFKGNAGIEMGLFSVIPPLFFSFWLVVTYKQNAANPVLLDFFYECAALAVAALAFYFVAGYIYKRRCPRMTLISQLIAVCLLTVFFADINNVPFFLINASVIGVLVLDSLVFAGNIITNN